MTQARQQLEYAKRHLEHLYLISKLLTAFEDLDRTFPALIDTVAESLPLRQAVLINRASGGMGDVGRWANGQGVRPEEQADAEAHAAAVLAYLTGKPPGSAGAGDGLPPLSGPRHQAPRHRGQAIVLPLVTDRRAIFGVLLVEGVRPLDATDLAFVNAVANQLAIAIHRQEAWRREVRLRERAEALEREQAALLQREQAARVEAEGARQRYQDLVNWLDNAIVWEAEAATGRLTFISAMAETLLGYPLDDWLTGPDAAIRHVHPDDRAQVQAMVTRAVSEGRDQRCDHRFTTADGRVVWFHTGVHVVQERASRTVKLHGLSVDITALKRVEAEREELLAVVSHDLRNPITSILLNAQLLKQSQTAGQRQFESITRAAERMTRLVSDLLDLANVQSGRLRLDVQPYGAAAIATEALDMLQPLAREKSLRLTGQIPPQLPDLAVDKGRVLQVLSNLVGNAIKFTPEGGTITLKLDDHRREVRFAVTDTGPGIPPEQLPHVFERYWQADRTARKGVGLGLSIAKGIVEAHGGRIWAESRPGDGSAFFFTLPTAQPQTQSQAA